MEKRQCTVQLNRLIEKKNNPFYELGIWQKALIAEETIKKQAAEIYREIIKNNGSMKKKAIKKVDELEKSEYLRTNRFQNQPWSYKKMKTISGLSYKDLQDVLGFFPNQLLTSQICCKLKQ